MWCFLTLQHLESAPKEILGDFPRFSREAAAELVYKTEAKHKGWNIGHDDLPDHMRNQVTAPFWVTCNEQLYAFYFDIKVSFYHEFPSLFFLYTLHRFVR